MTNTLPFFLNIHVQSPCVTLITLRGLIQMVRISLGTTQIKKNFFFLLIKGEDFLSTRVPGHCPTLPYDCYTTAFERSIFDRNQITDTLRSAKSN